MRAHLMHIRKMVLAANGLLLGVTVEEMDTHSSHLCCCIELALRDSK